MTWYLAVSAYFVCGPLNQQQAALEDPVWAKVKQNVLTLGAPGAASGLAVLIDSKGYFLAHRTAIGGTPILGRLNEIETLALTLVTVDEQTQLALLKAQNWIPGQKLGVKVATKTAAGTRIIAATVAGPVRGEFVSDNKVGQMRPSLRYTPLSEIRLESNLGKVGGALVFDQSASLVGLLGATLTQEPAKSGTRSQVETALDFAPKIISKRDGIYGPQGMTVAYSLGPTVLKRVVDGFLSADHKVLHPSVGLFFKDGAEPGAYVELVKENTPSEGSGIKAGDIIVEANGKAVRSPVDLAVILFECSVGEELTLKYRRDGELKTTKIVVGAQSTAD